MGLKLLTAPTIWPISLAAAKQQLRITHDDDDLLIYNADTSSPGLVQLATRYLEDRWKVSFLTQQWELSADAWDDPRYWRGKSIYLPRPPLATVEAVKYYDEDEVLQTAATTVYEVDAYNKPGRVSLKAYQEWPDLRPEKVQDVIRIQYTAGFTSVSNLFCTWPGVLQAIKLLTAQWYQNPEASVTGTISTPIQWTLDEISDQYNFNLFGY